MPKPKRRKTLNWGRSKRKKGKKAAAAQNSTSSLNTEKETNLNLPPILESETGSQTSDNKIDNIRKRRRMPSLPEEIFHGETAVPEITATVNPISQDQNLSLKIKRTESLNLLNKLKPLEGPAETKRIFRPNAGSDMPVSSCSHGRRSRMSRPVYLGDLSSSEDEEEQSPKNFSQPIPCPKVEKVNAIIKSPVKEGIKEENMDSESETDLVKLNPPKPSPSNSMPNRKRRPKRRLTMKKRTRVLKSLPAKESDPLRSFKIPPPTASPCPFVVVDIKELRICLIRVDDLPEFRELLSQFHRNGPKSLQKKTELFGSDSDDDAIDLDLPSEDEYIPSMPKSHLCEICDSSFADESSLEEHMETNHGAGGQNEKPIKCSYCSRFFTNRKILSAHESLHATKTKVTIAETSVYRVKLHRCPFCPKKFTKSAGVGTHIDKRHPSKYLQQQQQNSKSSLDGLDKTTYKLRKRIALAKKHIRPRREPIKDLTAAISDGSFIPPEPIYVNNGVIALGPVKRELKAENVMAIIGEPDDDNYFQVAAESMKEHMGVPVIIKVGHGEIDPLGENETEDVPTVDPLMVPYEPMVYEEEEENDMAANVIPFDMTNGVQCNLSDMGSLLDILDGPDPNSGLPGYACETLTLNYERNDEESGTFKCEYCTKVLGSRSLLQLHRKEFHAARVRRPYICLHPNCSQRFESAQSVVIHRNKVHSSRKEDVAEVPIVTTKDPDAPTTPLPVDLPEELHTNQGTDEVSEAMQSQFVDAVVDDQPAVAEAPVEQIPTAACATTIAERNDDLLKGFKYICKVCGAKFKKVAAFVQHEWEHSEDGTLSQCCPYCPRRFTDKKSYMLHTRSHIASTNMSSSSGMAITKSGTALSSRSLRKIQRNLICQHCHLIFPSPLPYISHINQVHADVIGPFKYMCSVPKCKKPNYKHPWNFRTHLASHSALADCSICGAKFKSPANLHRHRNSAHKNVKWAEMLSSSKLPVVPPQVTAKQKHQLCTTCMEKVDPTTEIHICSGSLSFTCEICQNDFESEEELKAHASFHRKLQCRLCPRLVFVERMDLHLESHLGETAHECKICRRPYVTRDSLVKHLKCKEHSQKVQELRQGEGGETYVEIFEEAGEEGMEVSVQSYDSSSPDGNAMDPFAEITNGDGEPTTRERRNSMDSQQSSQSESSNRAKNSSEQEHGNRGKRWLKSLFVKYGTEIEDSEDPCISGGNIGTRRKPLPSLNPLTNSGGSPQSQSSNSDDSGSSQGLVGGSIRILSSTTTEEHGSKACRKCAQVCSGIFGLGNHMLQAHGLFLCSSCNLCADSPEDYDLHIQEKHSDSKLYCKACKKLFLNEEYMTRHTEGEIHKLRVLQMENDALAEIAPGEPDLDCELECHHRNFVCEICSLGQHTVPKLEIHVFQAHKQFLCTICCKLFGSRNGIEAHRRGHVGESIFDCLICMIPYQKRSALTAHQRSRNHILRVHEVNQSSTEEIRLPIAVSAPFRPDGEPTLFIIPDQVENSDEVAELQQDLHFTEEYTPTPVDSAMTTTPTPTTVLVAADVPDIHQLLLNPKTGDYQCCLCFEEFQEFEVFYDHMVMGHDVAVFKKVSSRVRRLFRNLNQKPQIFKCSRCRKIFLDNNCFKRHWGKFHSNNTYAEVEINVDQTPGQGIQFSPKASKASTPNSQAQKNPARRSTPSPIAPNHMPITIFAPKQSPRLVYACVTCDDVFNNQVDLNIHAVKCDKKTKASSDQSIKISNVQSLNALNRHLHRPPPTASQLALRTKEAPEIIDLTEDDEEPKVNSSSTIVPTNLPSITGQVLNRENPRPEFKLLLQAAQRKSANLVIKSVYSLLDAPGILELPPTEGTLTAGPACSELERPSAEADK